MLTYSSAVSLENKSKILLIDKKIYFSWTYHEKHVKFIKGNSDVNRFGITIISNDVPFLSVCGRRLRATLLL